MNKTIAHQEEDQIKALLYQVAYRSILDILLVFYIAIVPVFYIVIVPLFYFIVLSFILSFFLSLIPYCYLFIPSLFILLDMELYRLDVLNLGGTKEFRLVIDLSSFL